MEAAGQRTPRGARATARVSGAARCVRTPTSSTEARPGTRLRPLCCARHLEGTNLLCVTRSPLLLGPSSPHTSHTKVLSSNRYNPTGHLPAPLGSIILPASTIVSYMEQSGHSFSSTASRLRIHGAKRCCAEGVTLDLQLPQPGQHETLPRTQQHAQVGPRPLCHNPNGQCCFDYYLPVFTKVCILYSIYFIFSFNASHKIL